MNDVWCVRAEYGTYTQNFISGGYVAIGWMPNTDLSKISSREDLYPLYKTEHPNDKSNIVIGVQVGQIARFLLEMQAGDFVITPAANSELLHYGQIDEDPSYEFAVGTDGCPYRHHRRIKWAENTINRTELSVPFQNTIRAMLSVFSISHKNEFLSIIGRNDLVQQPTVHTYDPYKVVLEQILQLDSAEFEILVGNLLAALGFEDPKVVGKSGDGGVDATGELNISNLAKVKVFVQAKRYQLDSKVSANTVRQLRQAIPFGGQGSFIITSSFQNGATDVALENGFPRIGLINGKQLVDLLVEHWNDIPKEFQDQLGLKPGLVRV